MALDKPVDEWIHACHIPKLPDGTDAVVIKTIRHMPDGTTRPHLGIKDKPVRSFYVTRPGGRNHQYKKEWELVSNLEKYEIPNYRLTETLANALSGGKFSGHSFKSLRQLCDSPFVYGADIDIEVLLKHQFMELFQASGLKPSQITTGFFDIETDVVRGDGSSPNIVTVTHENRVYTAILEPFFLVKLEDGSYRKGNLEEFAQQSKHTLDHHIATLVDAHVKKNPKSRLKQRVEATPFEYFFHIGKTALSLLTWIFKQIHRNKTDFIGIWNLSYDIPRVLAAIKDAGAKYEDIICPSDLPAKYRYVRYQPDEKDSDSIFKKWHWLHATGYSQFVDSQNLYAILRTVSGQESFKLNDVLALNDLGGKLTFKDLDPNTEYMSEIDWHRYMQRNEPYKYIIYNQFDCISLQLQEWKNNDISSMLVLGRGSRLSKWTRQTRKIADSFYFYGLAEGKIMASPGQTMSDEFDVLIHKQGGAVLRPERTTEVGMRLFVDRPDIITMMHPHTNDVDFTGMYPVSTIVGNISKQTKVSCGVEILGMDHKALWDYYSLVVSLRENAVQIGRTYFGLPGYLEMDDLFSAHLAQASG
jgi:hypothetical protein